MAKNTICLWYDREAEAAARFYAETFPDSVVGAVHRATSDYPSGKAGDVLTVEFTVAGVPCIGLNGGRPWTLEGHKAGFFKLIGEWEETGYVVRGLTFHRLRHTAATRLREAGYDLRTIADFLGQKTEGMAGHYSKRADLTKKLQGIAQAIDTDPRNAE